MGEVTLWLCFDAHARDGNVWAIREGNTWHRVASIDARVPLRTVYRGPKAKQPRAYLRGQGVVTMHRGTATLTPLRQRLVK